MDNLVDTDYNDGMKYCRPCSRWFKDHAAVLQHLLHSNAHDYCERCDREFVNPVAKNQHIAMSSRHNICHLQVCRNHYPNGGDFPSHGDLLDHFRDDRDHHYCFSCNQHFDSNQQLNHHFDVSNNHHRCSRCTREFVSDAALRQHWQTSSLHFLCRVCKRDFSNVNELVQHQKIHQPRSITCDCPLTFACFSALVIHWEAGKCTTNRQFLNKLILSFPEHRRFTVAEYITHLNGTNDRIRLGDDDDYSSYSRQWFCPIDDCQDGFPTLNVLDQHLGSPYHDVNAFKCPNTNCDTRFSCLSGLLQHVENAKSCSEDINRGTGCLGRLWLFLLEKFHLLPDKNDDMHVPLRVGYCVFPQSLQV